MEETLAVREYRPEDQGQVIKIVRDLQRHEGGLYDRMLPPGAIGEWYVDKQLQECAAAGGVILVAEHEGVVVGYASMLMDVTSADDIDEVDYLYAYVNDLGVTEGMRGRGVGTALLAACEERARRAGREWLRLSVLAANGDALRLYRRLGFDPHIVLMEKRLD
jgi:GNAT superfamily N-acetyltransferase